jgi:RNA polymerase sigma-70 factor (ECF subfamily)
VPAADQAQPAPGFDRVYDDNVWRVYGFLGYRLGSRLDAEDLTQQTFERALRSWERFDPERGSHETWLLSIARNLLIDHYRSDRSATQRPLPDDGEGRLPEDRVAMPDERGLGPEPELARALSGLNDRARELIALRYGGDLTGAEIAELTGMSLANVQQILSRSLRSLRAVLEAGDRPGERPAGRAG